MNHLGDTNKMVSDGGQAVSIEEQIITISTFSDCNYRRELRAIALEVRKREDRIKQLEEENNELRAEEARLLNTNGELERRIKRLESGGDKAILNSYLPDRLAVWNKAKEAS